MYLCITGLSLLGMSWFKSRADILCSLCSFIYERVKRREDSNAVVTRAQLGGGELCDPNHRKLAKCLQKIGDELDGHVDLQRWSTCQFLQRPCLRNCDFELRAE